MKKYIHYGTNNFNPDLFKDIKNCDWVKPNGGLWASDVNAPHGWKNWCEDEHFADCQKENSFTFKLKDGAKVLFVASDDDLIDLPVIDTELSRTISSLQRFKYLDFEKLAEEYDAMEVMAGSGKGLYWALYGWDCDSLLVFNKEMIEVLE